MPKLSDFKAALFDMDGTLMNSRREITLETRAALKALQNAGFVCGLCTGKHHGKIIQEGLTDVFSDETLHILSGGAQVARGNGEIIWEKTLTPEAAHSIMDIAEKIGLPCMLKHDYFMYANDAAIARAKQRNDNFISILKPITDPEAFRHILGAVLVEPPPEVVETITAMPDVSVKTNITAMGTYFDVNGAGVTKATGIVEWCKTTGIPPTEVIGFGDSDNDFEFLQLVGYAVALGNATPTIVAIADTVIGHTDDNGLATYIAQILETKTL